MRPLVRLLLLAGSLAGCAATTPLVATTTVPAARGKIKIAEGDNGNTKLDIRVEHLAPPSRVAPGASTFVVWATPAASPGAVPQNLGALRVDEDRTGELTTTTSLKQFDLTITPEASGSSTVPTAAPVMTARVSNPR